MMTQESHHFSKRVLSLSERAERAMSSSKIGRTVTSAIAGSSYPFYHQLHWQSADNKSGLFHFSERVPGDPRAGRLPRNWRSAAIFAVNTSAIEALKETYSDRPAQPEEAVAYIADEVIHIGTEPTGRSLFERLNPEESVIAMRLGKTPLEATMGVWLPDEQAFLGTTQPRIVEPKIHTSQLLYAYPGIALV